MRSIRSKETYKSCDLMTYQSFGLDKNKALRDEVLYFLWLCDGIAQSIIMLKTRCFCLQSMFCCYSDLLWRNSTIGFQSQDFYLFLLYYITADKSTISYVKADSQTAGFRLYCFGCFGSEFRDHFNCSVLICLYTFHHPANNHIIIFREGGVMAI